ncbi:hypothetical protein [Rosenbergiella australiborealis]|uniref:hypothetical protein n=1 Tax=Rosenbergiella australiborealis TaxID=1544696 RepID=UPI001F4DB38E|nr:hypothetical protein [Rosenbergiella australiborealis]
MDNARYINNLRISTNSNDLHDVASEVTALKVAFGLVFSRLSDADKNNIIIELTQNDVEPLNKLASELKQFMPQ